MPLHGSVWLNDDQHFSPTAPEFRQHDPEEPISVTQLGPLDSVIENSQLLAEGKYLCREWHSGRNQTTEKQKEALKMTIEGATQEIRMRSR